MRERHDRLGRGQQLRVHRASEHNAAFAQHAREQTHDRGRVERVKERGHERCVRVRKLAGARTDVVGGRALGGWAENVRANEYSDVLRMREGQMTSEQIKRDMIK